MEPGLITFCSAQAAVTRYRRLGSMPSQDFIRFLVKCGPIPSKVVGHGLELISFELPAMPGIVRPYSRGIDGLTCRDCGDLADYGQSISVKHRKCREYPT